MATTLDFPANSLEKPGYRLEFYDEFQGAMLDETKWLPYYIPQWSSRSLTEARYSRSGDGLLLLQFMLNVYEFPDFLTKESLKTPFPKIMEVDYVRAYQLLEGFV